MYTQDNNSLPVWIFVTSLLTHISINSQPFFGGIVSHCTAEVTRTNLVGELPGYGTVWFHPDGIANILSLARVKTKYRITFDSDENNEFVVHKPDGSTRNFKESSHGLYYHDTSTAVTRVADTGMVLVTTVADNASNYTHADYTCALLACKTQ